jgi:hypothetical protein
LVSAAVGKLSLETIAKQRDSLKEEGELFLEYRVQNEKNREWNVSRILDYVNKKLYSLGYNAD